MFTLENICVFCGSNPGHDPRFLSAASELGAAIAQAGLGLVFGGGGGGLMGRVAQSTLDHGGRVTGIIPVFLKGKEPPLHGLQQLIEVETMHQRKQLMFDHADAFIALPGGLGTLEELAEQMTWAQLQRHAKPLMVVDIAGFWRPLLALLAHMSSEGFIPAANAPGLLIAASVEEALPILRRSFRASPSPIS